MSANNSNIRRVLMIPLRRCGSHALRLRLNSSSEFYAPYPLHVVDFMPILDLYGDLSIDNHYFQLITDIIGLQSGLMVKWPDVSLDPVEVFDAIKDEPRSIHRIIWEMLLVSARKEGASVIMDKSLDNIHYADELLELFPDMLFLNVVRDPRAQISSMNKAIIHDFDIMLNALTWNKAHEKARQLEIKHPEKVLTIRFEDFISNQTDTLRYICDFLDIQFSEQMLDIASSQEAKSISTRSALWEFNSSEPIAANVDKFKTLLTQNEIETIETLTGEYMDLYGYERMTSADADVGSEMLAAAQQRSVINKEKAWKQLRIKDPRDYMLRKYRLDYIEMVKSRLIREEELFQKLA